MAQGSGTKAILLSGLVALVVGLLVVVAQIWILEPAARSAAGGSANSDDAVIDANEPMPQSSSPIVEEIAEQTPVIEQPIAPVAPPPAPVLVSFQVETAVAHAGIGKRVGPNYYEMLGHGYVDVAVTWEGRMSDGTASPSAGCQTLVSFTGPESIASIRTDRCALGNTSILNPGSATTKVTVAGEYVATVLDELTGASGSVAFTIAPWSG
ncbi:MAG: hypothetical protein J7480_02500 [Microbacteriaceae bacterium]|nr:hypothetical protein [Microbacteriaceae bacterium]